MSKLLTWSCFATFLFSFMLFDLVGGVNSFVAYDFSINLNDFSDPFLFANVPQMATKWFIYYAIEHYVLMATFFMFWRATGYNIVRIFFIVQVVDFIDYLIFYNETYFFIGTFPVSYNILSFTFWMVLGIKLFYEWITQQTLRY